jgi:hypothetical protein
MTFPVFDYRTDNCNVLIAPQIRARLMRIEVGEVSGGSQPGSGHSHDLVSFLVRNGTQGCGWPRALPEPLQPVTWKPMQTQ